MTSLGPKTSGGVPGRGGACVLTVGGHEESGVDLSGVAEVGLDLVPARVELPVVDPPGSDVEHVEPDLRARDRRVRSTDQAARRFVFAPSDSCRR